MRSNVVKVMVGLLVVMALSLTGCDGGGSSRISAPTVSGTASEGALITGKAVKLKDANGKAAPDGTTNTTTGIYSIDVTGLSAPYLVTVTGTNGTYVSLAQTAGKANINPITTTVVALAAGNSDVSALFANLSAPQLTAINTNYAAKSALVTTSLQTVLPSGVKAEDYFTGTITAGKDMDAIFDTYKISINATDGITVKTKDANAATILSIPTATVVANTPQPLPKIGFTSAMISGKTFNYSDTAGHSGTPTFNANGHYSVTNGDAGTWSINAFGQLVLVESSGGADTMTLIAITGTVITASDLFTHSDGTHESYTVTLTAGTLAPVSEFTSAMISGKTFNYHDTDPTSNNGQGDSGTGMTFNLSGNFYLANAKLGTWSINSDGRLITIDNDGAVNTLTITSVVGNVITSSLYYAPPNNGTPRTFTATLTEAATIPTVFTSAMINGKTFNWSDTLGNSGTPTFNSNGHYSVTNGDAGTWSINASGQLVIIEGSGGADTMTLIANTGTVITASDLFTHSDGTHESYTVTLTAVP